MNERANAKWVKDCSEELMSRNYGKFAEDFDLKYPNEIVEQALKSNYELTGRDMPVILHLFGDVLANTQAIQFVKKYKDIIPWEMIHNEPTHFYKMNWLTELMRCDAPKNIIQETMSIARERGWSFKKDEDLTGVYTFLLGGHDERYRSLECQWGDGSWFIDEMLRDGVSNLNQKLQHTINGSVNKLEYPAVLISKTAGLNNFITMRCVINYMDQMSEDELKTLAKAMDEPKEETFVYYISYEDVWADFRAKLESDSLKDKYIINLGENYGRRKKAL